MAELFRQYKSETALDPAIPSSSNDQVEHEYSRHAALFPAKSVPAISHTARRTHPLLVQDSASPNSNCLLLAAETLENIVAEGSLMGNVVKRQATGEVSDAVLRIVYGTMKFLPYIDNLLVKTQFLVYNTQFLGSLCLVKVVVYELMKVNFDFRNFSIVFDELKEGATKLEIMQQREVRDLERALHEHQVKLAAAWARVRIARKSIGDSDQERMENILPLDVREKEMRAGSLTYHSFLVEMPKTLRINFLLTTLEQVEREFENMGFKFNREKTEGDDNCMFLDHDFPELIVVPSDYFGDLKASQMVADGRLIFQDKASMFAPKHLINEVTKTNPKGDIIDARSGCGNRTSYLSFLTAANIYAFEGRPTRVESLRNHLSKNAASHVQIIPSAFITSQVRDFPNVSGIIVEPPNSGSAIMDRLGFLLQEEEFPAQQYSKKDLLSLKRTQISYLKHAFSFPSVQHIVYVTRSTSDVENQQVVNEVLDRYGVDWELDCVMPEMVLETQDQYGDYLQILPSEEQGNGVFVAHFRKKNVPLYEAESAEEIDIADEGEADSQDDTSQDNDSETGHEGTNLGGLFKAKKKSSKRAQVKLSPKKLGRKTFKQASEETLVDEDEKDGDQSAKKRKNALARYRRENGSSRPVRASPPSSAQNSDIDLSLTGICLKRFYAPQFAAVNKLKHISANLSKSRSIQNLWAYPVFADF